MMGELTASIAHELNQPLTAIVSNGRAARRMLEQRGRPEPADQRLRSDDGDEQQPREVVVSIEPIDGRRAEVAVRDTGTGIGVDAHSLFDAFYTTKPSGLGIGLSVARSILEAHGGDIRAVANSDGGATVRFTLPLAGVARS